MSKILVYKQSHYPVSSEKIKDTVQKILRKKGLVSDYEVSVALVGEKKITELAGEPGHPVLAYAVSEIKEPFVFPQKGTVYLGEIIVSYPAAVKIAKESDKLIDQSFLSLVEHGILHLLGIHHP